MLSLIANAMTGHLGSGAVWGSGVIL